MSSTVNSRWRVAAIVLALLAVSLGAKLFLVRSELKDVFHYDVTVTLKDKDTGEILEGATVLFPATSGTDLFHQSTSYGGSPVNPRLSGIAYQPRKFGFSLEGYSTGKLQITDQTAPNLTVELERKTTP